jgi:cyclic dehypoxanthinyl futalosine synthase
MSEREALELLRSHDLLGVGARAHEVRERTVPGPLATFIIDRNINFTNVCTSGCRFCAFHRAPGSPEAYVLSHDAIHAKIQETLDLGGTAVMMQGGLNPDLDVAYYEQMFRSIKERFDITIHSLSAPEIVHIAQVSGLTTAETLRRLKAAGLDSLPGGGAEILVDRVRQQVAPGKADTKAWLQVMREAHLQGIAGTATMMFGSVETLEVSCVNCRTRPGDSGRSSPGASNRGIRPWREPPSRLPGWNTL